jgi:hypothetical protein
LKGAGMTGEPSISLRLPTTTTSSSPANGGDLYPAAVADAGLHWH